MIESKSDLKRYLHEDEKALYPNGSTWFLKMKDPIWKFQILLRKCEYHRNCKKGYRSPRYLFYKWRMRGLALRLSFSIPENCFAEGLSIAHYGSIIVNPNARIGKNCRIHVGVNIGANKNEKDVPTIGDNVYIGPGAKIFGKISIGNNVKIGANAVVLKDAPDNAILVGIPARNIAEEKKGE